MLTIKKSARIYTSATKANEVAKILKAGDDDNWEYRVVPDPKGSGKAIIKIYDEENKFVGDLSI